MALNADEVIVAITGEIYVAPVGSTAPTTHASALDAAFEGLGFISEDGVTESFEESREGLRVWQNATKVRTITTESEGRLAFTLVQSTRQALELYHPGSVMESDGATGYKMDVVQPKTDPRSFVFDVIDGDTEVRIYIPRGEVIERGETQYVSDNAVGYNVTIATNAVELNGRTVAMQKFSNNEAWAPAVPPTP